MFKLYFCPAGGQIFAIENIYEDEGDISGLGSNAELPVNEAD
jgi:hypothetical protein